MRGRVRIDDGDILLGGMTPHMAKLAAANRIIIVACGTSHHAGLIGEYLIETFARIPTEVKAISTYTYMHTYIGIGVDRLPWSFVAPRTTQGSSEST